MNLLYNILITFYGFLIKIASLLGHKKAIEISKGRTEISEKISEISKSDKIIWFHAASSGEFEQAKPLVEKLKKLYKNHKIVVSFYSPSGYNALKNYTLADIICYLPLDTKSNVRKFINKIHPEIAIIIKYEFWPNLLSELKKQQINTILISGIFRKEQSFFKWYGFFMRNKLSAFNHFFIQNEASKKLLLSIGIENITIAGDTRCDRVYAISQQKNTLGFISDFKNNTYTVVAGSTWKEDEKLLVNYINNEATSNEKFIIVPHNIYKKQIEELQDSINKKTMLYSEKENGNLSDCQVFIVDTIGLLTKIYSYADVAYVGGGFKTNLHSTLEPAAFGLPVIFGNKKFEKFQEAIDLLKENAAVSIGNKHELSEIFSKLKEKKLLRKKMGANSNRYIKKNTGATKKIIDYIKTTL